MYYKFLLAVWIFLKFLIWHLFRLQTTLWRCITSWINHKIDSYIWFTNYWPLIFKFLAKTGSCCCQKFFLFSKNVKPSLASLRIWKRGRKSRILSGNMQFHTFCLVTLEPGLSPAILKFLFKTGLFNNSSKYSLSSFNFPRSCISAFLYKYFQLYLF